MICGHCGKPITGRWLNTGYGPHHEDCWIRRTTP